MLLVLNLKEAFELSPSSTSNTKKLLKRPFFVKRPTFNDPFDFNSKFLPKDKPSVPKYTLSLSLAELSLFALTKDLLIK